MDSAQPYSIRYHENNQEVALEGSLRPQGHADLEPVRECLNLAAAAVRGTLYLNLKRLRYLNHLGFLELARFLARCQRDYTDLRLKLVTSSAVPWAPIRFGQLTELFPNAIAEQYDKAFYPGQASSRTTSSSRSCAPRPTSSGSTSASSSAATACAAASASPPSAAASATSRSCCTRSSSPRSSSPSTTRGPSCSTRSRWPALRIGEDIANTQSATVPPNTGFPDNGEYTDAGDTCPGTPSPCEGGLCAKPDKDCTPRWLDTTFEGWEDVSGVDLGTLSTTPQYFVEYLGNNFPCNTNDPTSGAFDCKRYRITARSGSSGDRASVILQSIFATE